MKYHIKHQLKSAFQEVIIAQQELDKRNKILDDLVTAFQEVIIAQQELDKRNKILDDLVKKHCHYCNRNDCELVEQCDQVKEWTDGYNSK